MAAIPEEESKYVDVLYFIEKMESLVPGSNVDLATAIK